MDTVASNSGTPDMHGSGRTQRQKRQDANSSCRDGREIQNTAATFNSKWPRESKILTASKCGKQQCVIFGKRLFSCEKIRKFILSGLRNEWKVRKASSEMEMTLGDERSRKGRRIRQHSTLGHRTTACPAVLLCAVGGLEMDAIWRSTFGEHWRRSIPENVGQPQDPDYSNESWKW